MNKQEAEIAFRCVENDVRLRNTSIQTALIKHGFLPSKFMTPEFEKTCHWYHQPERTVAERNAFWNNSRKAMLNNWESMNPNGPEGDEAEEYNVDGDGETKEEKAKREAAATEYQKREQEINMEVTRRTKQKILDTMDRMADFCRSIADNGGDAETCFIAISSLADIERTGAI